MKVSRIVFIVFIFCNFYLSYNISVAGTNEIVSRDEAVSAKLFVEGKSWFRVADIYETTVSHRYRSVTVKYKVVKGYSELLQNPDEIVIEIDNPAIDKSTNNPYRIVLSPKGTFLGYRFLRNGKWYDWRMRSGEKFEKRLYREMNSQTHFRYYFFPLPILWKDSSFQLDNFSGGLPIEVTTKVENDTLKVICRKFRYQKSEVGNNKWMTNKDARELNKEIQMTFKKGEPWAASITLRKENFNFNLFRLPED